jgi:diguanylate cyclase (GGDEF)-like protein
VELPTTSGLEFATSSLSTAVVVALAIAVVAALAGILVLLARLSRRTRELARELEHRQRAEAELQDIQADLDIRVRERTQALEARNLTLETANQRLKRLVTVDSLTGIANRSQFDRALDRELRRARRDRQPLSLIFLDLDEFKRFNDTYGHIQGDEVLRRVALSLDETFRRGGDLVARYGGEEFAVVLPGVDARRAGLYAERLRRRIWRLAITNVASQVSDRITISAGVATITPHADGLIDATPDALLRAADQALYRAKCLGRNRVCRASTAADAAPIELAS